MPKDTAQTEQVSIPLVDTATCNCEYKKVGDGVVIDIVIGRKINYSVPDDWYFPISDHQYVLNPFYYSPDEWY